MRRDQLQHLIRAAAQIVRDPEVLVFGSQAILGSFDESRLPKIVTASDEADLAFLQDPEAEKAELVSGILGELSMFHESFKVYADGVETSTPHLSPGWKERLVILRNADTFPGEGRCLEPHDIAASKLAAGRPHDSAYVRSLLEVGILDASLLRDRLEETENRDFRIDNALAWLDKSTLILSQRSLLRPQAQGDLVSSKDSHTASADGQGL